MCGALGATIGCCQSRCPVTFHFRCGLRSGVQYLANKRTYCATHRSAVQCATDEVSRHVMARPLVVSSEDSEQARSRRPDGERNANLCIRRGSLVVLEYGRIAEQHDSYATLYPVGYRAVRRFWSVRDPHRLSRYECAIAHDASENQLQFHLRADDGFEAHSADLDGTRGRRHAAAYRCRAPFDRHRHVLPGGVATLPSSSLAGCISTCRRLVRRPWQHGARAASVQDQLRWRHHVRIESVLRALCDRAFAGCDALCTVSVPYVHADPGGSAARRLLRVLRGGI